MNIQLVMSTNGYPTGVKPLTITQKKAQSYKKEYESLFEMFLLPEVRGQDFKNPLLHLKENSFMMVLFGEQWATILTETYGRFRQNLMDGLIVESQSNRSSCWNDGLYQ